MISYLEEMGRSDDKPCPDVMLLDLNLPKVGGPELLKEFRKHPQCRKTPVIVISSSDSIRDREQMLVMEVAYYFKKTPDLDEYITGTA